jgi:hypothetical protein
VKMPSPAANTRLRPSLSARTPAALSAYVMSWIRTAPGVVSTEMSTVQDWRWLADADDLVELCGLFFQNNQVLPRERP